MNRPHFLALLFLALLFIPSLAWACGSRWVINALSELRLMHFSFFMGLVMGTPLILSKMSEFYRKDFPKLPKLGYFKSLALVLVCGLSFQLALGFFMDTRSLTSSPAFIIEEAKAEKAKLIIDQADLTPQDFESILQTLPNPK
jgi:Ni/Fe-hydrogenase subunit HybB-like protein